MGIKVIQWRCVCTCMGTALPKLTTPNTTETVKGQQKTAQFGNNIAS